MVWHLFIFLFSTQINAQQPVLSSANNECSGASNIVFNTPFNDNNTGATQSQPANSCNGFVTPGQAKDVWFKFTYASGMDSIVVDPGPNPNADIVTELFSGSCGNLTAISCSNFAEPNSNNQSEGFYLNALGLTIGTEYYFRVYGSDGIETTFTVLAKTASNLPPPANDDCISAQQLSAGQTIPGNSIGATQSLAPIACNGFTSNSAKDVWFKFQKIPQVQSLLVFPESTDMVLEVLSGCGGTATSISCSDNAGATATEQVSLATLTNGTVYYARVYGRNGTAGNFSIKLSAPPANDNCATASELLPNVSTNGKTVDATQSEGPSSVCGGSSDDDVWYFFMMAQNIDSLILTPNFFFNSVVEIRSSPCSSSVAISCAHTGGKVKLPTSSLTVGTKYYVRVYSHDSSPGTFSIQLTQGSGQGPANDQCSNPQSINPAIGVLTSGNSLGATQTFGGVPCGGLGSTSAKDVWYSFTRTPQRDTLYVDGLGNMDLLADIRTACTSDSLKACLDLAGNGEKKLDLSEIPEGTVCLLRIYGRNGTSGDFSFRFAENVFIPNPPANNDCFSAQLLTLGNTCNPIGGTTISSNATAGLALPGCASGTASLTKDVWYKFVANGTKMMVKLTCDSGFDGVVQVLSGSCFGPQSLDCANDFPAGNDPDFPVEEEIFLTGLTSGNTYFVRVFGNNGSTGNFSICAYNPNCNSTVASMQLGATEIMSNQAFTSTLSNAQGAIDYQVSPQSSNNWKFLATSENSVGDTLVLASSAGGNFSIRTKSRTAECFPAFSVPVQLSVRCATAFSVPNPLVYLSQVKLSALNNSSDKNPLGGSVQDFSSLSTPVCKGVSYPLGIKTNAAGVKILAWADFNQDGDFTDAGENLLDGVLSASTLLEFPVQIPASATSGNCRMRVMAISPESVPVGSNPCAEGPYGSGEIEEYSLTITTGAAADAGADQAVGCPGFANLSGNSPGTGNTGLWTLVSGSGTISNPASANTTVNNLGSGINVFRWSINNTCGNISDEVAINFNVPNPIQLGSDTFLCPPATFTLNGPGTGISSYLWSNGSTGNSLLVTAPGIYWLQVQTADGCNFRDSIEVNICTGNNRMISVPDYSLVPNPASGPISLRMEGGKPGILKISLQDALGRLISTETAEIHQGINPLKIPAGLPEGVYLIRLMESGKNPVLLRLIKE
jgi:hypothetical protein